jgi:acyl-CoA thioesterase-2
VPQSVAELIDLLELDQVSETVFVGRDDDAEGRLVQRVFGGQVLAQALTAAYRTVAAGRVAHSLGAYFLRGGLPGQPIHYRVEVARDGGSFSTRRVVAAQGEREIFSMVASFHTEEPGLTHSDLPPEGVPAPE